MVHTHANWSVVEPHGTGLDSLHHLNSMRNVTIHLRMLEQTHKHTLCAFIKVVLELWRDNVMLPYFKPLNKAWMGCFAPKKRSRKIYKKRIMTYCSFSLLTTQQAETKEGENKTRTLTLPCRSLIQSHIRVIPTSATQQDALRFNAVVTTMITDLSDRDMHQQQTNSVV